jgi:hypothetical protein
MSYQKIEVPLGTATFAAGAQVSLDLGQIQAQQAGRINHVSGFKFVVRATPTLSSGAATAEELQKAVRQLIVRDGTGRFLFNGSFASRRLQEAVEFGGLRSPEPDQAATTEAVNFQRVLPLAPGPFRDGDDFVQPAAVFRGGSMQFAFGALTDVDANCTALALTIYVYAICQLHDELIFGAQVERVEQLITNGQTLGAEALYAYLALCDSAALGAIAAGDFANVEVLANGFQRQAIHAADLERMYHDDMGSGGFTLVKGEPLAATDDNPKVPAGTAIAAAPAQVSPIIWSPPGAKISKLVYHAMPNLVVKWSGSQGTAYALMTRLLPRSTADFGKAEALVKTALAVNVRQVEARTASKAPYTGPRRAYMPLKLKVG